MRQRLTDRTHRYYASSSTTYAEHVRCNARETPRRNSFRSSFYFALYPASSLSSSLGDGNDDSFCRIVGQEEDAQDELQNNTDMCYALAAGKSAMTFPPSPTTTPDALFARLARRILTIRRPRHEKSYVCPQRWVASMERQTLPEVNAFVHVTGLRMRRRQGLSRYHS